MSEPTVISLSNSRKISVSDVGPKAMSLIRMMRIGLPVPSGFCITAESFHKHIFTDSIISPIKEKVKKLRSLPIEEKNRTLRDIRSTISKITISENLIQEVGILYRSLNSDSVAVRSSATAEDMPGHSFAGQYETFLDVTNLDECLKAIKKCWASLWTERAYNYREKNSIDHFLVNMAVIVQVLIHADSSGVLFTADPIRKRPDRIVLESSTGLGEKLVSGKVTPDRFILDKKKLTTLSRTIFDNNSPSISISKVLQIARIGKKVESLFNTPQDIEWAIKEQEIFLLQSRPITTAISAPKEKDMMIWTNLNIGEIMPDVATPLSWSMIKPLAEGIFGSFFGWIGLQLKGYPLIGHVAGRLYFNLNFFIGALRRFPGMKDADLTKVLGGAQGKLGDVTNINIPEEAIPNLNYSFINAIFSIPNFIRKLLSFLPKNALRFIKMTNLKTEELSKINISSLSERELIIHLHHIFTSVLRATPGIGFSMEGMFFYGILEKMCKKWLADSDGKLVNRLLVGIEGMDSAIAGLELWQLVEKAKQYPKIAQILSEEKEWNRLKKVIPSLYGGDDFLSRWDFFMKEHGHHTRGELELFNPRWSETPDYILQLIQGYLRTPASLNPIIGQKKAERERDRLADECRRRLKNPMKKLLFSFTLNQAQIGSVVRENIKSRAVRYWAFMRSTILELGERFSQREIIEKQDDIFFLRLRELHTIHCNTHRIDVQKTVNKRRREYEKNLTLVPPKVVVGTFDPDNFIPDEVDEKATIMEGLAVSPGVVTGPARVILKATTKEQVLPGEILVAPFTDPGWTPYFLTASGIVMDMGGILSHGSIIAREYGIPTVVNVGPATKIIATGQIIQIDGTRGIVKILD